MPDRTQTPQDLTAQTASTFAFPLMAAYFRGTASRMDAKFECALKGS